MIETWLANNPAGWAGYPTTALVSPLDHEDMYARERRLRRGGYTGPHLDMTAHRRIEAWIASERLRRRQRYQANVNAVMTWI